MFNDLGLYSATRASGDELDIPLGLAIHANSSVAGPDSYSAPAPDLPSRKIGPRPPEKLIHSTYQQPPSSQLQSFAYSPPNQRLQQQQPIYHHPQQHPHQQHIQQPPFYNEGRPQVNTVPNSLDRDTIERSNSITHREVARLGAAQNRNDQCLAHRETEAAKLTASNAIPRTANFATQNVGSTVNINRQIRQQQAQQAQNVQQQTQKFYQQKSFDQLQQMQQQFQQAHQAWQFQQAHQAHQARHLQQQQVPPTQLAPSGAQHVKTHAGVKYERKATGPFIGKLVSQGTIINIDGEDYVEYRVLTKPTFF